MLNVLTVNLGAGRLGLVVGGPYHEVVQLNVMRPVALRVKLAQEVTGACDHDVAIQDFDVPRGDAVTALRRAVGAATDTLNLGGMVLCGCMGGRGRTGLFMACLVKHAEGVPGQEAIQRVRRRYNPHAVETPEQQKFVDSFEVHERPKPSVPFRRSGTGFFRRLFDRLSLST